MPKLRWCVLTTIFALTGWCTTLVERFLYRFTEDNIFTRLNHANIDVGTPPECIPCMILATYINMYNLYTASLLCAYSSFWFHGLMYNTCRAMFYRFAEINVFTSLNTANINVETPPECSMHEFSNIEVHKHVIMRIFHAKASLLCAYY